MGFISKLEKKFGKYAVKNLTIILIGCYVLGYMIERLSPVTIGYLTLDPYRIIHGEVWRIVSWILIPPPESNFFFAVIMLFFYFSIGTMLERTWGSFQYNLYLFSGMIFTVLGSFLLMLFCQLSIDNHWFFNKGGALDSDALAAICYTTSILFSTYYVNMSIFLAYACTFPESQVLFMFFIPVKVKVLGFIYGGFLVFEMVDAMLRSVVGFAYPFVIGASLLNFGIFFFTSRKYIMGKAKKTKAQKAYNSQIKNFQKFKYEDSFGGSKISKHKCAICGRTEKDGDDLVFRFCSKCDGNYEYCQNHLYTHIHFTKGE